MKLYDHQQKALEQLGNGKILRGGVGSGKTLVAAAYYIRREAPRDVYVITTAKKRDSLDWEKEFASVGVGKYQDATCHGVLTVDSWNNIKNYVDVRDAFFIFDEQRAVGSGAWTKSFVKIAHKNNWIMLSATPGDTWLDYIPVFVANGFYKNRSEFLREHVVFTYYSKFPKVERYIGGGRLVRHRNNILVEMPYYKQTQRIIKDVDVTYDAEMLERVTKDRWNVFKERPLKDIAEMFSAARRVVNSHPSRIQTVQQLLRVHPKVIIFYNFDYELEMLRSLKELDFSTTTIPSSSSNGLEMLRTLCISPEETGDEKIDSILHQSGTTTRRSSSTKILESRASGISADRSMSSSSSTIDLNTVSERSSSSSRSISMPFPDDETSLLNDVLISKLIPPNQLVSGSTETTSPCTSPAETSIDPRMLSSSCEKLSSMSKTSTTTNTLSDDQVQNLASIEFSDQFQPLNSNTSPSALAATQPSIRNSSKNFDGTTSESMTSGNDLVIAEWNGHKHEPIPTSDRWVYLVQYVAGAEGWNCIETDAMVFWSLTYSYKNWEQAMGRIDRLNTPFEKLYYYVLQSDSWIDKAIRKALRQKKSFNESDYVRTHKEVA